MSIPTIKFYLREGLVKPGVPTARNQADYDDTHLRRVRMIRTLTTIGGLDLAAMRELLPAVDDRHIPADSLYTAVNEVLCPRPDRQLVPAGPKSCLDEVSAYVADLGLGGGTRSSAVQVLADVVAALRELGCDADLSAFDQMARLASALAAVEIEEMPHGGDPADRGSTVARTVLFDVAFTVFHRLAHTHYATTRAAGVHH